MKHLKKNHLELVTTPRNLYLQDDTFILFNSNKNSNYSDN
jgi:hypothetical protein